MSTQMNVHFGAKFQGMNRWVPILAGTAFLTLSSLVGVKAATKMLLISQPPRDIFQINSPTAPNTSMDLYLFLSEEKQAVVDRALALSLLKKSKMIHEQARGIYELSKKHLPDHALTSTTLTHLEKINDAYESLIKLFDNEKEMEIALGKESYQLTDEQQEAFRAYQEETFHSDIRLAVKFNLRKESSFPHELVRLYGKFQGEVLTMESKMRTLADKIILERGLLKSKPDTPNPGVFAL